MNINKLFSSLLLLSLSLCLAKAEVTVNPESVVSLLKRVANIDSEKFTVILDTEMTDKETFTIDCDGDKPLVKASTMSALTTGINWYLNHYAHVNISWNNLTTDLSNTQLPLPTSAESHTANVDLRYYLNYCTFSYSMSTWTWDRWQKEIDWMALHGINMPLQIVGLEVVWRDFLIDNYGYTTDEANAFVAGPCFQAWFGMNNLEGWGGPNPEWWYTRQQQLATKILARERELGIEPVLPGFSGMVPHDFTSKTGIAAESQGGWCGFQRPFILDPTSKDFADVAKKYYATLKKVMGTSRYYSMDPFHEGGRISSGKYAEGYTAIFNAMNDNCGSTTQWVIQQWQWASHQATSLNAVPAGRLLVLDLFSDGSPAFDYYNGYAPQISLYCTISNFGGRSGFMGRLDKQMKDFFAYKSKYPSLNGIGATPEAIEQVPVIYDNLYELPWMDSAPANAQEWLSDYTIARYGQDNADAREAWECLRTTALNCTSALQGPHEAVYCARPSLDVYAVSSWGGTEIFYATDAVVKAAYSLLNADIDHPNYQYDLIEISRQALSDYAKELLSSIKNSVSTDNFNIRRDAFLSLILDIDTLLATNENFRLGHWTQMARDIADEIEGTTDADRDWLELDNARTLITTWGDYTSSEQGGLRDYSYRAWSGMLKDFYYPRWKYWFDHNMTAPAGGWFFHDWEWAHNLTIDYTLAQKTTTKQTRTYSPTPEGDTREVVKKILPKYIVPLKAGNTTFYIRRIIATTTLTEEDLFTVYRNSSFTLPLQINSDEGFTISADLNQDDKFDGDNEACEGLTFQIPENAPDKLKLLVTHTDGTKIYLTVSVADEITSPRTVSVFSTNLKAGSVAIEGTTDNKITTIEPVTLKATPNEGYRFVNWGDKSAEPVSTKNPYVYVLAPDAELWAYFEWHPWATVEENYQDMGTIQSYAQYVNSFTAAVGSGTASEIYSTATCPTTLCHQTEPVYVAPRQRVTITWSGNDGLSYCYLSTYIDADSNGSFEKKIATRGTASAQNQSVVSGSISFTAPSVECNTLVRFRFDSAWRLPDNADFSTTRMIYDIPLIVTTTTAINEAPAAKPASKGKIYNLQGQPLDRVDRAGLYIIDGRVTKVSSAH